MISLEGVTAVLGSLCEASSAPWTRCWWRSRGGDEVAIDPSTKPLRLSNNTIISEFICISVFSFPLACDCRKRPHSPRPAPCR